MAVATHNNYLRPLRAEAWMMATGILSCRKHSLDGLSPAISGGIGIRRKTYVGFSDSSNTVRTSSGSGMLLKLAIMVKIGTGPRAD